MDQVPEASETTTQPSASSQSSRAAPNHQQAENSADAVSNLQTLLEDMKAMTNAELMSEVLVNSMDSHPRDEAIQILCIRTATAVFAEPRMDAFPFLAAKGHKRILFAMKTFPASLKIQEEGCEALAVLSVHEGCRLILIRAGTCRFIDKALIRFLGDEALAESAMRTLRSLSFEAEGSAALDRLSMLEKLVEVMQCNSSSATIQRDGCALLSNLSVDVEKQQVAAVKKNVLSVIITTIKEHKEDPEVVASACFALKNLTHEESNLRSLTKVDSVLEVIYESSKLESAAEDASIVLERMQVSLAQDESLEDQALESLKALVEQKSEQPEVVGEIIKTLDQYQWSERTATECVKILLLLASESEAHKSKLSEESNLQHLQVCANASDFDGATRDETLRLIGLVHDNGTGRTA